MYESRIHVKTRKVKNKEINKIQFSQKKTAGIQQTLRNHQRSRHAHGKFPTQLERNLEDIFLFLVTGKFGRFLSLSTKFSFPITYLYVKIQNTLPRRLLLMTTRTGVNCGRVVFKIHIFSKQRSELQQFVNKCQKYFFNISYETKFDSLFYLLEIGKQQCFQFIS